MNTAFVSVNTWDIYNTRCNAAKAFQSLFRSSFGRSNRYIFNFTLISFDRYIICSHFVRCSQTVVFFMINYSVFGEDALVNVSVEKKEDGKLAGYIRIRSKTQGIALSLGDRITSVQRGNDK